jgi:hypothetical protein
MGYSQYYKTYTQMGLVMQIPRCDYHLIQRQKLGRNDTCIGASALSHLRLDGSVKVTKSSDSSDENSAWTANGAIGAMKREDSVSE